MSERRSWLPTRVRRGLYVLLAFASALVVAELGVRAVTQTDGAEGSPGDAAAAAVPRWGPLLAGGLFEPSRNPDLRYSMRPGFRGTVDGIEYRVNELGMRGPEVPPKGPRPRWALVGDSYAFGLGAAEGATLHDRLAVELDCEVLSLGVPAYHTGQSVAWLAERGPDLELDGVLFLHYGNDVTEPGFLVDPRNGQLYTDLTPMPVGWKGALRHSALHRLWTQSATEAYVASGAMEPGSGVMWPVAEQRLERMRKLCAEHGWPLVVLNLPMVRPEAVVRDDAAHAPDREDAARVWVWAYLRDVAHVQLVGWLVGSAHQGRLDDWLVSPEPGPLFDDHFNAAGNAALARELAPALRATGFFESD